MRIRSRKSPFQPSLERVETRIVATAGLVSAAAHHVAPHPAAHVEAHFVTPPHQAAAAHPTAHPKVNQAAPAPTKPTTTAQTPPSTSPSFSTPTNTTTNQAWVEIQNTTGETLEYYIKLGPYENGQFIPFDIAPGQTQYQYSSLISNGQRVKADFAIQFGNGPITPLMTGVSQRNAQGYDIFLDGNLQPYVYPFVQS
jgi:hypothetical protein